MISSYVGLNPTPGDWLWHQTPYPFGEWGQIQMGAPEAAPDFLLLYQYEFPGYPVAKSWKRQIYEQLTGSKPTSPQLPPQLQTVPKERIMYLLREPPLDDELAQYYRYNYEQAAHYCGYVSGADDAAPIPNYMPAIWYICNEFRELADMPPPTKHKTCSWITSGIDRSANHLQRLEFLKLLQSRGVNFDLFGRNLPSWAKSGSWLKNKWHAMAPYYYNLTIENYAGNAWYVTEKLWDALLSWCLPIYYGGAAADQLLPPGSFLRLPSLDEHGLRYINEVTQTPDAWYDAKDAIAEARQIILHKLNLLNWVSDYVQSIA